jgi:hypothetical protein
MTFVRWLPCPAMAGAFPRGAFFACPDERSGTRGFLLGQCQKELAEGTHHFTKNQASIFKIHFIRTNAFQPKYGVQSFFIQYPTYLKHPNHLPFTTKRNYSSLKHYFDLSRCRQ